MRGLCKFFIAESQGIVSLYVPLDQTEEDFVSEIRRVFPSLGDRPLELCRMDAHHNIIILNLPGFTPHDIKECIELNRSAVYVRIKVTFFYCYLFECICLVDMNIHLVEYL